MRRTWPLRWSTCSASGRESAAEHALHVQEMLAAVEGRHQPPAAPREATLTAPDRSGVPGATGRTASWCGRIRRSCSSPMSSSLCGRCGHRSSRAALRHRDPVLCPVGALARWLVLRWEICGETPPDFRRRSSWYTTKVLPGKLS
jgi:hypothetical protein